jgi:hypothetical protein
MLPPFDDYGNLPPGIHSATMDEIIERFGTGSPEREVEASELADFVKSAIEIGVRRIIVNGSFTTGKLVPNDVDLIILPAEDSYDRIELSTELSWPFLQIIIAADAADLERWALEDFGTDRRQRAKGVVEVVL